MIPMTWRHYVTTRLWLLLPLALIAGHVAYQPASRALLIAAKVFTLVWCCAAICLSDYNVYVKASLTLLISWLLADALFAQDAPLSVILARLLGLD